MSFQSLANIRGKSNADWLADCSDFQVTGSTTAKFLESELSS